jgi:hypothetical protein
MRDPHQIRDLEQRLEAKLDARIESLTRMVDRVLTRHGCEVTSEKKKAASASAPAGAVTSVSQEVAIGQSA